VAVRPRGEAWQSSTDETGSAARVDRLPVLAPRLLVLEATGGWERHVSAALAVAGCSGAVVNPRHVRAVAQATGRLATTAAIDAAVLAHCAPAWPPTAPPLPDAATQALAALVERRRPLVTLLTAAKNRLQQAFPPGRATIVAPSAWREQALTDGAGELDQLRHASPLWRARDQLPRRVPGVGPALSRVVLAHLPEWGEGSVKQLAPLVGGAPLNRDRGAWRGRRARWGGRQHVRAALSRATLVGVRHPPLLPACYERLGARGQPKTVALPAGRHNLLTLLHAVLRDRTPWAPGRLAVLT